MKRVTAVVGLALLHCGGALGAVQCKGTFSPITGDEWVKQVNPGWNLGNTLDAVPNEELEQSPRQSPRRSTSSKRPASRVSACPVRPSPLTL